MDWLTERPPSTVDVCGETVPIRTGWRRAVRSYVLMAKRCDSHGSPSLGPSDVDVLLSSWFTRDGDTPDAVRSHPWQALEAAVAWRDGATDETMPYGDGGGGSGERVFDWKADSGIVRVDFLRLYGIDLSTWQAHWWEFRLMFDALVAMPDSLVAEAVSARTPVGDRADKWERERHRRLARAWALPPNQAETMQRLREVW